MFKKAYICDKCKRSVIITDRYKINDPEWGNPIIVEVSEPDDHGGYSEPSQKTFCRKCWNDISIYISGTAMYY